jgi:hypothetical protein
MELSSDIDYFYFNEDATYSFYYNIQKRLPVAHPTTDAFTTTTLAFRQGGLCF